MSDWAWVALGFGITYGAIGAYLTGLAGRRRRLERQVGE